MFQVDTIGIDPGKMGAIARFEAGLSLSFESMPLDDAGAWDPWAMRKMVYQWKRANFDLACVECTWVRAAHHVLTMSYRLEMSRVYTGRRLAEMIHLKPGRDGSVHQQEGEAMGISPSSSHYAVPFIVDMSKPEPALVGPFLINPFPEVRSIVSHALIIHAIDTCIKTPTPPTAASPARDNLQRNRRGAHARRPDRA